MVASIPRYLTYADSFGKEHRISEEEIPALKGPLVILGEPGSGKTFLMNWLGTREGMTYITAKALLRKTNPEILIAHGGTLVIDALDELSSARENDPLQDVLEKLDAAMHPNFILSCRVADWQGATARKDIVADYGDQPTVLLLSRLTSEEAILHLSHFVPKVEARRAIEHLDGHGLSSLYGNPLTLDFLKEIIASKQVLPDNRAALFTQACELLWSEVNENNQKKALNNLTRDEVLNAAGAACAALILTGCDALSFKVPRLIDVGDLTASDILSLPFVANVQILKSCRLFRPHGEDRLVPIHRLVAEYLGARWIALNLKNPSLVRRVFSMLTLDRGVPASLRGIHAWLAYFDPSVSTRVINNDPYGLLRYGETEAFSVEQARALLNSLKRIADEDPYFRAQDWGRLSASGLVNMELRKEIEPIISKSESNFQLRTLLLEAMKGSELSRALANDLQAIVLDDSRFFAERSAAMDVLCNLLSAVDLLSLIDDLRCQATEDSTRLAVESLTDIELNEVPDITIVEIIFAYLGLTVCPINKANARGGRLIGGIYSLWRFIPEDRIPSLLDFLAETASELASEAGWEPISELSRFAANLILIQLDKNSIDPIRLWNWIKILGDSHSGDSSERQKISDYFLANRAVRQAVQRHVLFESLPRENLWMQAWELNDTVRSLAVTPDDASQFLEELSFIEKPNEVDTNNWRDLIRVVRDRSGISPARIEIAKRFSRGDMQLNNYLAEFSLPVENKWEKTEATRIDLLKRKRDEEWAKHRIEFSKNEIAMRSGELRFIVPPAQAYIGLFQDSEKKKLPSDRIVEWLGQSLSVAALAGFEAVLHREDLPNPNETSKGYAEQRRWNITYPILAGLIERVRIKRGFSDLTSDVIKLGLLVTQYDDFLSDRLEDSLNIDTLRTSLETELSSRAGEMEAYWHLLIEPQLDAKKSHPQGLYRFLRAHEFQPLAEKLAIDWLERIPYVPVEVEIELVDFLMAAADGSQLRKLLEKRITSFDQKDESSLLWMSVGLLLDFERVSTLLVDVGRNYPNFLWILRERIMENRRKERLKLEPVQAGWIIQQFRSVWPLVERPSGVTSGDKNHWDAGEFIRGLIVNVARDTSDAAQIVMSMLRDTPADSYSETILHQSANQGKVRREANFKPTSFEQLKSVMCNAPPMSVDDLQAVVLDVLETVQELLRGSDTNPLDIFYKGEDTPAGENYCRDRVVEWVHQNLPKGVIPVTEARMPDDKRSDIAFAIDKIQISVEIKTQWHKNVWDAAVSQLDALYTKEWRSEGRGVYLVLWFGDNVVASKKLKSPPGKLIKPSSAAELCGVLTSLIPEARRDSLAVFVLDLSR